jgi:hypothetical protein
LNVNDRLYLLKHSHGVWQLEGGPNSNLHGRLSQFPVTHAHILPVLTAGLILQVHNLSTFTQLTGLRLSLLDKCLSKIVRLIVNAIKLIVA